LRPPLGYGDLLYQPPWLEVIGPHLDGFVYPHEAAEALGVSEEEVVLLARRGALQVRGEYVRPALVAWVSVKSGPDD
jgi:hypothetical protein